MKTSRPVLDGLLDATAHLLATGATANDYPEWSPPFAARVREAAERTAGFVDWAAEGMTSTAGLSWTVSTLEAFVMAHLNHARRGPTHTAALTGVALSTSTEWELEDGRRQEELTRIATALRQLVRARSAAPEAQEQLRQKQHEDYLRQVELARIAATLRQLVRARADEHDRARQKQRAHRRRQTELVRIAAAIRQVVRTKSEAEALARAVSAPNARADTKPAIYERGLSAGLQRLDQINFRAM